MILLFIVPALFTTNVIVARAAHDTVPPFALAYWRWMLAFLIFLPVVGPDLWRHRAAIAAEWRDLLVLGGGAAGPSSISAPTPPAPRTSG